MSPEEVLEEEEENESEGGGSQSEGRPSKQLDRITKKAK